MLFFCCDPPGNGSKLQKVCGKASPLPPPMPASDCLSFPHGHKPHLFISLTSGPAGYQATGRPQRRGYLPVIVLALLDRQYLLSVRSCIAPTRVSLANPRFFPSRAHPLLGSVTRGGKASGRTQSPDGDPFESNRGRHGRPQRGAAPDDSHRGRDGASPSQRRGLGRSNTLSDVGVVWAFVACCFMVFCVLLAVGWCYCGYGEGFFFFFLP